MSKKIFSEKIQINSVNSKVDAKHNIPHKPGGGDKPIFNERIKHESVSPRVEAKHVPAHKPGGGDKKVNRLW